MATLLDDVNSLLTEEINNFAMANFIDSRITQSISNQYYIEPLGFAKLVDIIDKNRNIFIDLVRQFDSKSFYVANLMSVSNDPRKLLAYWVSYYVNR